VTAPGGDQIAEGHPARPDEPAVAAAQGQDGPPSLPRPGRQEVLALAGLLLVWPVGVVLLWRSRVWSTRDKLIGTLVPPGGLPLAVAFVVLLIRSVRWSCEAGTYDANGSLISPGNCPPEQVLNLLAVAMTVLINGAIVLWPLLAVACALYLVWRAWRPAGRPWLALVVAVVVGPLAVLLLASASFVILFAFAHGPPPPAGAREAAVPSPLPTPFVTSGFPVFPDLTPSLFRRALGDQGIPCQETQQHTIQWITSCGGKSGAVQAVGSDASTIEVVTALPIAPEPADPFLDAVVQSACRPADAERIKAWVQGHSPGDETDIDGYHVVIGGEFGPKSLIIVRSRP